MRKNSLRSLSILCLGAFLAVSSCKKDNDPAPGNNNNNNNNGNSNGVYVAPGASAGAVGSIVFNYHGNQVTYPLVRAKDGKIWMQKNLGAAQVAVSITDAAAYGDLYQWGRWVDGHEVRTPVPELKAASALSSNNPSGLNISNNAYINDWWSNGTAGDTWIASAPASVSATNGCDPCKALGDGWHLPTEADWSLVIESEGITNNNTAFASNLKIPAGGWRNTNSTSISSAGTSSWYWSSTTTASSTAKGVWIQASSVQKSFSDSRAYGTSVRCVKD